MPINRLQSTYFWVFVMTPNHPLPPNVERIENGFTRKTLSRFLSRTTVRLRYAILPKQEPIFGTNITDLGYSRVCRSISLSRCIAVLNFLGELFGDPGWDMFLTFKPETRRSLPKRKVALSCLVLSHRLCSLQSKSVLSVLRHVPAERTLG